MNDLIYDLKWHRQKLNSMKTSNGFECECDPSVGMEPCELCFEKQLIDRAIAEIEQLRKNSISTETLFSGRPSVAEKEGYVNEYECHIPDGWKNTLGVPPSRDCCGDGYFLCRRCAKHDAKHVEE